MAVSVKLKQLLDSGNVPYKVEVHPVAYTAQEVAEASHMRGREVIKTVVVIADGTHVLAAVPSNCRVDIAALKTALGAGAVRLAEEREFIADFPDCEVGAMPPFGSLYSLRLLAAEPLRADEDILFNAGSHREAIRMKREDWERLTQPEWADFARPAV